MTASIDHLTHSVGSCGDFRELSSRGADEAMVTSHHQPASTAGSDASTQRSDSLRSPIAAAARQPVNAADGTQALTAPRVEAKALGQAAEGDAMRSADLANDQSVALPLAPNGGKILYAAHSTPGKGKPLSCHAATTVHVKIMHVCHGCRMLFARAVSSQSVLDVVLHSAILLTTPQVRKRPLSRDRRPTQRL